MKQAVIVIKNQIDEINKLAKFVEKLAEEWNLSPKSSFNLNLVLEEIVSNIILYGYENYFENTIEIDIEFLQNKMQITVSDNAKEFNPLLKNEIDVNATSLEEREIGGLGIHFLKQTASMINYKRQNNMNILNFVLENSN